MRLLLLALLAATLVAPAAASARTGACTPGGPACHFSSGRVVFVADGDTIDVSVGGRVHRVRMTGINAMELHRYSHTPSLRRGDCHGVEATARLERLLRRGHMRVRLAAQDPASHSGRRLRRQVSTRIHGHWVDVNRKLVAEGHALWLPNGTEWAWNRAYHRLSLAAAKAGRRLWNPRGCGAGAAAQIHPTVQVNPDADGNDYVNVNGEWARIGNPGSLPLNLHRWWFRDSDLRRYTFPAGAVVPPHGSVLLRMGRGEAGDGVFYWGLPSPPFENPTTDARGMGDGGYLFDPRGNLRAWDIY
jgi:endonuclease YncB( thermonuclease family)